MDAVPLAGALEWLSNIPWTIVASVAVGARLASMLWTTARSPLTFGNEVEILQDAREKYPRLLSDIEPATDSIHLLYYERASDPFTENVGRLLAEKARQGVGVRIIYDCSPLL